MSLDPIASTGMLVEARTGAVVGACAIYAKPHYALTAAHCVAGRAPEDLRVVLPAWEGSATVGAIHRHPKADLAVMWLEHEPCEHASLLPELPFAGLARGGSVGADFGAYGYPEYQGWNDSGPQPTGRLFKGHVQRLFDYVDPCGSYSYPAIEMSIPSPRGLSGGPLFSWTEPDRLIGIAAANIHSTTPGEIEGTVSYGVAVLLWMTDTWLADQVCR